ncbi:MAG: hypothetical protein ACR2PX_08185 [Endozoicomonas sp.]|uniref:hypothetical protein n=1 Tax=Endozoicomonas sp. TaxID=1892382 RepID=UPI003D9BAB19
MDWLPEAARVLKPGGVITINGYNNNPFVKLPENDVLESLSLEVIFKNEPLLERFANQEFHYTDGGDLRKDKIRSTALRKRR